MPQKTKGLNARVLLLLAILITFGTLPAFAEDSQGTMEAPDLSRRTTSIYHGCVQIDGKPEFQWEILKGDSFSFENTDASVKFLWNKKTLYMYAVVEDKTRDADDNIWFIVSVKNGKTRGQTDVYTFYRDARAAEGHNYVVTENGRGYSVEAAVILHTNPIPGDELALDVRIANTETYRLLSWNESGMAFSMGMGTGIFGKNLEAAYCLYGTPSVDGEMDPVWNDAIEITPNTWVQGIIGPAAKVRTLWDEANLYVYAQVTGKLQDDLWEKDSMEVFLDRRNDKAKTIEEDDARYRFSFDNNVGYGKGTRAKHLQSQVKALENGYAIEASIAWDTVTAVQDSLVGFDVQLNSDGNRDGNRDTAVTWNDSTGLSEQSVEGYGVLRLAKPESLVFTDVYNIAWAKDQIELLGSKQIVRAYAGQKFEPMREITRADFLHYLINTLGLTADADSSFDDVPPDAGYAEAVATAKKLGITNGVGNNQFLPMAGITRQEMMTLVVRALDVAGRSYEPADETVIQSFTDVSLVSDYAAHSVAVLVKNGIIQGSGNRLNPRYNLTRAEAAVLLYRIYTNP